MESVPTTVETAVSALVPASRTRGLSAEARTAVEEGIPAETRRGYAGGPWGYVSVAAAGCLVNQSS